MSQSFLEFHFEYNPNRKNVGEVFFALGNYVSAYESFGKVIADAIGNDLDFCIEINDIQSGSIKLKLLKLFDELTSPNELIKDLTGEIGSLESLSEITQRQNQKLSRKVNSSGRYKERVEPSLNDLDVALAMEKWSDANRMVEPDEKLTITDGIDSEQPSNVINIDTGFRLSKRPRDMFSNFIDKHDDKEIVDVIRPCFRGDLNWRFQNTQTKLTYNAPIKDSLWLEEYQNGQKKVDVKDSLLVHSAYELWRVKGKPTIKNAQIKKVIDIIECNGTQCGFFGRD
ncbi:TPA: hypothetical protein NJY97_004588 [Vibrio parahaemolyticus]|nr:hypothetical protein [Vibrio parahaemolyticus]HCE1609393.1 hypothetical protein [Vibrio parahaemolyticus]HCE5232357.1 hypothetical protein [Vibrio parahaemolyticus]HCG5110839.1 hypothetical protein [Vibrio parahaemolyticus]HCG5121279.1 hypothetical protein [Vibrio parahaemolyticus]